MNPPLRPPEIDMASFSDYLIRVQGNISVDWTDYFNISIMVLVPPGASAISTICAHETDQAGLYGLLDRLYTQGYPLLCVKFLGRTSR